MQAQPPPQRQVLLHWQRSPQLQRSAVAFAQPHDVFSHRHSFWVWLAIGSLLVRGALSCALSQGETQTRPPHYTQHAAGQHDALDGASTYGYLHVLMPARAAAEIEVSRVSRLFKALGDDTRLRIVALLAHGELCVCHVQEALSLTQPNASRQLSVLKNAGIVESRRQGTWTYYRLTPQVDRHCGRQLETLVRGFAAQAVLKKDVERLLTVRGPAACR